MTTTLITTAGKQAIAEAIANKTTLKISRIAVGDGAGATYTPTVSQTALKGQKWSGELNRKVVNPENQKQIIFEGLIASGIGGFFIREVGLFDDNNVLIAISDFPESFKATADQYELYIRMILEVSNTNVTNIIVNNDLVYATKEFVEKFVNSSGIAEELAAHQRDIEKKVDKVTGKGLSTNDYTTTEKNKLAGIATAANNYVHPSSHPASMITEDATHRFVSDTEKNTWNNKETTTGAQAKVDALAGTGNTKTVKQIDEAFTKHQAEIKDYVNTRGFLSGSDLSSGYTIGDWKIGTSNLNSASGNIKMGNSTGNIVCNNLTQTSKRELKKNIKSWDGDGYGIVKSVPVRQFQYIDELDEEFPHVGFILDEVSPWMADIEGNGVSVNQTVNILFDALQTAIAKIERLEGVINNG
ncbi:phage tail protein [Rummeliibacillus stabekisii]|uniref:Phage tail fibre protein N-terminal domain-containing protein n=1 Tax=Rummeliibacillus stabekisii TaxID=241244 RepID=A0A143HDH4_9BACL|nr:phage tail protein [Rummeliibacillus stabekisii]AMW99301.1 hypothetical protein ATY39_07380 [Rummeliibacillus stabekisii]